LPENRCTVFRIMLQDLLTMRLPFHLILIP